MKVAITAGPTREYLDPIRFLSNRSSGKMGYALAQVMLERGFDVHLISGPVSLQVLSGCDTVRVETADQMFEAVCRVLDSVDILIMAAAVSDYTVAASTQKLKKTEFPRQLTLFRTVDLLSRISKMPKKPFLVGFSAESESLLHRSELKLREKHLDMIVANPIAQGSGFGSDFNEGFFLFAREAVPHQKIKKCSKIDFAKSLCEVICDEVAIKNKVVCEKEARNG